MQLLFVGVRASPKGCSTRLNSGRLHKTFQAAPKSVIANLICDNLGFSLAVAFLNLLNCKIANRIASSLALLEMTEGGEIGSPLLRSA